VFPFQFVPSEAAEYDINSSLSAGLASRIVQQNDGRNVVASNQQFRKLARQSYLGREEIAGGVCASSK